VILTLKNVKFNLKIVIHFTLLKFFKKGMTSERVLKEKSAAPTVNIGANGEYFLLWMPIFN